MSAVFHDFGSLEPPRSEDERFEVDGDNAWHAGGEANVAIPLRDNLDFAPATALLVQGLAA